MSRYIVQNTFRLLCLEISNLTRFLQPEKSIRKLQDCKNLVIREMTLTDKPALGIAEKSPQRPRKVGVRTCNGKPDPCGNA